MDKKIEKIKHIRNFILKQVDDLTPEQLNFIPESYNNNIIWNLGHLISTTQILCYRRAGVEIPIDDKYVSPFIPGTKSEAFINADEIKVIKDLLTTTIDTLEKDVENNIFINYTKSERIAEVYGMDVSNIEDALEFLLYHEGYHTGYLLALKHLV